MVLSLELLHGKLQVSIYGSGWLTIYEGTARTSSASALSPMLSQQATPLSSKPPSSRHVAHGPLRTVSVPAVFQLAS